MRKKSYIVWIAVGLFAAWAGWQMLATSTAAQPGGGFKGERIAFGNAQQGGMITMQLAADATGDRIVVIDTQSQTMAVYHIGNERGEIRFESERPLRWDLQMNGFNSESPTSEEVRSGLERNK